MLTRTPSSSVVAKPTMIFAPKLLPMLQNQPGAPSLTNKDVNAAGQTVMLGPFNIAGTFYLICSLHHNMMLKIIVT